MTELQRRILEALDNRGPLTFVELETVLDVKNERRGGFRGSVALLERMGKIDSRGGKVVITTAGVVAVEAANMDAERHK